MLACGVIQDHRHNESHGFGLRISLMKPVALPNPQRRGPAPREVKKAKVKDYDVLSRYLMETGTSVFSQRSAKPVGVTS